MSHAALRMTLSTASKRFEASPASAPRPARSRLHPLLSAGQCSLREPSSWRRHKAVANACVHWRVEAMMSIAVVMAGIYVYIRASVFKALRRAVDESAWPVAAGRLDMVRKLVSLNLVLGVVVFGVAIVGRAG